MEKIIALGLFFFFKETKEKTGRWTSRLKNSTSLLVGSLSSALWCYSSMTAIFQITLLKLWNFTCINILSSLCKLLEGSTQHPPHKCFSVLTHLMNECRLSWTSLSVRISLPVSDRLFCYSLTGFLTLFFLTGSFPLLCFAVTVFVRTAFSPMKMYPCFTAYLISPSSQNQLTEIVHTNRFYF